MAGAEANPVTGNVLIHFRGAEVDEGALVAALARFDLDGVAGAGVDVDERPAAARRRVTLREGPRSRRVRIAVRGLDRDSDLGRRVVERLERRPEVSRVMASPVTGRVLLELAERKVDLEPILAEITGLELPALPDEDLPRHPLDPAPLIQSSARLIGSSLGLGLLAMRHLVRADGPPVGGSVPAAVAGAAGVVEGMVPLERRIESALGRDATQLLLGAVGIASLTFSGNFLGLVVAGSGALGLVSEVRRRRSAWRAYENRLGRERVHAGETLRLDPGDTVPLRADVLRGVGRAVGPDGAMLPVAPGRALPAGARVYGQPLTVRLGREPPVASSGRRQPAALSGYERYLEAIVPASLAYGALLGVVRRSVRWAFTGLLLVNPRAALIGVDQADNRAAAYVLRSGVTVVGTRRGRPVRRPDALVLGCPRTLTDGLEVGEVIALMGDDDRRRILEIAGAVAGAAGSPWGPAFAAHGRLEARGGSFDGAVASAEIGGERWTLRNADDGAQPDADRLVRAGEEPLLLVRDNEGAPAGVVSVRPRLAAGIGDLRDTCRRRSVELVVVDEDASSAGRAIARRADVPRTETKLVAAIDER
ncbi:MAG: family hydrolase, partial [Solirubrobacterales bacterium]|nr:family hydrolase [Solirubrobacterales bacterium]